MSEEDATGGSTVRQIGSHYILDEVLGQGSMGTVWRGHDLNDGSSRAIKVLKPELTNDKGATRRFIQERDILMTVADDAVVRVTDMVVESSTFAIIMELVDGPDLAHVLESMPDHRLEPATAVCLGIEVCQALTAIHRVGIRHLDIKPANILIEDREEVRGARITDFGVSEMVASGNPHEIVGTPYYQAPEVAAGRTPLAASDLYSFGVTLYQLLAGRVPFQADAAGNILRDQPPDHIPGVDPRLWNTIMTCLAPDPAGRPASAELLASELRSWLDGGPPVQLVVPRPLPPPPTPPAPVAPPQPVPPYSAPSATRPPSAVSMATPAPSAPAAHAATSQRGSDAGWFIALLALLLLVGAGAFVYLKGMPGSHSEATAQPIHTATPAPSQTPEVRPMRTVTVHATVTTTAAPPPAPAQVGVPAQVSVPAHVDLPAGASECGPGTWVANTRTDCSLALNLAQLVPPNHPSNFFVSTRNPQTGRSHKFFCNVVGEYLDCSNIDLEVYLVIPR